MRFIPVLMLLLALGACSTGEDAPKAEASKAPTSAPSSAPKATDPDPSRTKACTEVRAGIDAFNASDFEGTVGHFKLALPLARSQAEDAPSKAADDLVEAIEYYAELAPEDYPESARSSPDFLKYKTITLGQCVSGEKPLQDATKPPSTTT